MKRSAGSLRGPSKQLAQSDVHELVAMIQGGKAAAAESRARKLAKRHPDALVLLDVVANAQLAQSKFRPAAQTLEKLVAARPDHIDAHYNLGLAWMNLGEAEKAVEQFRLVADNGRASPDVYTNLGAALYELERYVEAIEAYRKAVELKPDFVPALRNLGTALRDIRELEESEEYLAKLPVLAPQFAPGHASLAVTQKMLGETNKALKSLESALALDPENREAHYEVANLHYDAGEFGAAIEHYRQVDTETGRVRVLEALHQAGRTDELLPALADMNRKEPRNLRGAAFSAFASHQYEIENTHRFAPDPLEFVSIRRIDTDLDDNPSLLDELIGEAERLKAVWENHTTRGGFQSYGNIFEQGEVFRRVKAIVRREIEGLRSERKASKAGIIRDFPQAFGLDGWHVKLMRAGFQRPHIHARGWFSGVLYLKVPQDATGDDGAISFSLHGYNYRVIRDDVPERVHRPRPGDLVLFPSSLFHKTVPFESAEDRQCIAFDMLPVR